MKTQKTIKFLLGSCLAIVITSNSIAQNAAYIYGANTSTCSVKTFSYEPGTCSYSSGGGFCSFDFGDGSPIQTLPNQAPGNNSISHNFPNTSSVIYTVTLSAYTNSNALTPCSTATNAILANCGTNSVCNSNFSILQSTVACNNVNFVNTSIGNGTVYKWNFGDGTKSYSSSYITNHIYPNTLATYTIILDMFMASDTINPCGSSTQTIGVNCLTNCNAIFSATQFTTGCNDFLFVNNSNGYGNYYKWDYGDGTFDYNSSQYFNHLYPLSPATYTATLYKYASPPNQYALSFLCDSSQQIVTVNCSATCLAAFSYTSNINCNGVYLLNNSIGIDNTYKWNFGDGNVSNTFPNYFTYYYSTNGTYTINLDVYSPTDTINPCSSIQHSVVINCSNLCQSNAAFNLFADSLNPSQYFGYNTSSGNGTLNYLWDFGDGSTSNLQYPFHQYATPGQYIVCLQVTSSTGTTSCTDTYCDSSSVHRIASGFQISSLNVIPQAVTGIQKINAVKTISAYPNPFSDELTIEVDMNNSLSVINYQLHDALGKIITENEIKTNKTIINTASLEHGFYFISIKNNTRNVLKSIKVLK